MSNLQLRRGHKVDLPNLELAEPGYSYNTEELHIGNGDNTYATFIDEKQLSAKIKTVEAVLNDSKTTLQDNLNQKVKLDNQVVDLNLSSRLADALVIDKIQITHSSIKQETCAIASDSQHVMMQNGFNLEQTYAGLLKDASKTYASKGAPIIIDNGIPKQKVLSAKIAGQTVKCIFADKDWVTINATGDDWNASEVKLTSVPQLKVSSTYVLVTEVKENTFSTTFCPSMPNDTKAIVEMLFVPLKQTGIFINKVTTKTSFAKLTQSHVRTTLNKTTTGTVVFRQSLLEIADTSLVNGYIPYGLQSVQARIQNNAISYPFYASAENKTANKIIELNKIGDTADVLESLESGSGSYIQNTKKMTFKGDPSEGWTIATADGTITRFYTLATSSTKKMGASNLICDNFELSKDYRVFERGASGYDMDGRLYIKIENAIASTVTQLNAWLALNPTTFVFSLAKPIVTYISKELTPVMLMQASNKFILESAVKPTDFQITAPVNKVAINQARIEALKAQVATLFTLSTEE